MMIYTRVPSFSSTVEEFLTGSGLSHLTCHVIGGGYEWSVPK